MKTYLCIAVGGFFGAAARFGIKNITFLNKGVWGIPLNTLIVNILGSFILIFFLTAVMSRLKVTEHIRFGVSVGFLGAFTTFCTLCKELVEMAHKGLYITAATYAGISMLLGMGAAFLGMRLAESFNSKLQGCSERSTEGPET